MLIREREKKGGKLEVRSITVLTNEHQPPMIIFYPAVFCFLLSSFFLTFLLCVTLSEGRKMTRMGTDTWVYSTVVEYMAEGGRESERRGC